MPGRDNVELYARTHTFELLKKSYVVHIFFVHIFVYYAVSSRFDKNRKCEFLAQQVAFISCLEK